MNDVKATESVNIESDSDDNRESLSRSLDKMQLFVVAASMVLLATWFYFDNCWPSFDAGSHCLDELKYRNLFRHPHPFDLNWYWSLLTVNYGYAPLIHAWNGFLKVIFGISLLGNQVSLVLFCGLLNFCTYGIAKEIFNDRTSGVIAALTINCFPLVASLSHVSLLDYPHLALYSLAMYTLVIWNRSSTWPRTILLGTVIGMAVSAKQIGSFYLVGPCLTLLVMSVWKKQFNKTAMLTVVGLIATSWLLLWIIPNYDEMKSYTVRNELASSAGPYIGYFLDHINRCLEFLPKCSSYILFPTFLACLALQIKNKQLNRSWLFALSSITGVMLLSALPFQHPEARYIVPVFLWEALVIGYGIAGLLKNDKTWLKTVAGIFILLTVIQTTLISFVPYPIPLPNSIRAFFNDFGLDEDSYAYPPRVPQISATPPGDIWGQEWVIKTIKEADKNKVCYLFVMPSENAFNVHLFALIAKNHKSPVIPTTNRVFTMNGDKVQFDEKSLLYFDWYLLKSNMEKDITGFQDGLLNTESLEEVIKQQRALLDSNHFYLFAKHKIVDGSTLYLYKQNTKTDPHLRSN